MPILKKNMLITGLPGIGKTTLVKRVCGEVKEFNPIGFYTAEIREGGVRKGFELISLDGRRGLLSHIDLRSHYRVGRYKVDISAFEGFLDTLPFLDPTTGLVIIDEIGGMECFSSRFLRLVREVFDSEKIVIATVAIKGRGLIEKVKKRSDVLLFAINAENRDSLVSEIVHTVKVIAGEGRKD